MAARLESLDAALEAVREVGPTLREHAAKAEAARSVTVEVVDALSDSGLFGAFSPISVGGGGLGGLVEQYEITRAVAYEDSTAGWIEFICGGTATILATRLGDEGRGEVFADGVLPMAGVFNPSGQGCRVDDGIRANGSWQFASGITHSPWVLLNVLMVDEDGAPTEGPAGPIDVRGLVVRRDDVSIVDDWHVAGLRGTGSMSCTMEGVVVPEQRSFDFFFGAPTTDEAKYRLPIFSSVAGGFAAMAVGIAQRMLDEIVALLPTKARPPTFVPASENPTAQLAVGRAMAALRAAHESTLAIMGRYDARADGEDLFELSMPERAEIHQQVVWAVETCTSVATDLFRLGGASSIYEPNVLQRCWRDLNVLGQHLYVSSSFHEVAAKLELGQEVVAPNL